MGGSDGACPGIGLAHVQRDRDRVAPELAREPSTASPSRSPSTTAQPSPWSRRAIAAPMPRPAPVTIATVTRAGSRRSRRRGRRARRAGTRAARGRTCARSRPPRSGQPVRAEPLAEAAADDDRLHVEQCHGRADPDPERLHRAQDQLLRNLVARLQRAQPDPAREPVAPPLLHQLEQHRRTLLGELARPLLERPAARIRLDATLETAVAAAAAGLRADVADLAGRAAARELPAVHHDAAADARAPEDAEERVEPATGAEAVLGLDRDVDVVSDPDGPAELLGERRPERERRVPALDVRHLEHAARLGVDRARSADADARRAPSARRRRRRAPRAAPRRARRRPPRARPCGASPGAPCRALSPRRP